MQNCAKKIEDISETSFEQIHSGISEFDRVLGGGITKNSLTLIGGEPGVGKSTLLSSVLGALANNNQAKILYVSGEESSAQIAKRIKRVGAESDNFYIFHEAVWQNVLIEVKRLKPDFLVIDSIQTMISLDVQSIAGSTVQIREVTHELLNYVKGSSLTCFIIGHITKDGAIAGPKLLEHMVDTVVYFEGDQLSNYRILRAIKNRFGSTSEVGIFEMDEHGLHGVENPGKIFLAENRSSCHGSAISTIFEGSRSILIEVQSLVVENRFGNGKKTTQGLDANRLSMMVAIIEKYFSETLSLNDIYLNIIGGAKLLSRDCDLAVIASLLSSYKSTVIEADTVFLGEVGLTGEVRSVKMVENRLAELEKLNYKKVFLAISDVKKFQSRYKIEMVGLTKAVEMGDYIY